MKGGLLINKRLIPGVSAPWPIMRSDSMPNISSCLAVTLAYYITFITGKTLTSTVMSRASTHGRSQLNHQELGVGSYPEDVLI